MAELRNLSLDTISPPLSRFVITFSLQVVIPTIDHGVISAMSPNMVKIWSLLCVCNQARKTIVFFPCPLESYIMKDNKSCYLEITG